MTEVAIQGGGGDNQRGDTLFTGVSRRGQSNVNELYVVIYCNCWQETWHGTQHESPVSPPLGKNNVNKCTTLVLLRGEEECLVGARHSANLLGKEGFKI